MIRDDLFSFAFIKKSPFFGSWQGMQYRVGKEDEELEVCVYPGPYSFDFTPEEEKIKERFPFSPEGYEAAKSWIEKMYAENTAKWS